MNSRKISRAQLPPLRAMENPADYDIDKDMGEDEVDETKIGKIWSRNGEINDEKKLFNQQIKASTD